ncbi:glycosyltransferase family 2 protein, partial [Roseobacter sp.]
MRWARKRLRFRARRVGRKLTPVADRTSNLQPDDIILFSVMRDENLRLPYFLQYYRDLGVSHFCIVDNDSTDGSADYLAGQPDVSLWHTGASYKAARYGVDWLNDLQSRYAHGHWCVVVDADEFLIYPFCDTRPLHALTDWLDSCEIKSFSTMLLDMYPKGRLVDHSYQRGQNPMDITGWFDSGNYTVRPGPIYGNLWIQGGPRSRVFFDNQPRRAPALNKIPLVKWDRRYAYVNSTHMLLPSALNRVYDSAGGEKASGILLHAKFLDNFTAKAAEEVVRNQHHADPDQYRTYVNEMSGDLQL